MHHQVPQGELLMHALDGKITSDVTYPRALRHPFCHRFLLIADVGEEDGEAGKD